LQKYHGLIKNILNNGEERDDRTGVGTYSLFDQQICFDLTDGFPLVTTKKMFWKGIVFELLWMIKGKTNIKWLNDHGVHIWDDWARDDGELGPVYGKQLRNWKAVNENNNIKYTDQLKNVINNIKNNPTSRRHVISLWNAGKLDEMELVPCHGISIQFYVHNDNSLSCKMHQRSMDVGIGAPFNFASYALLTHMVAKATDKKVNKLTIDIGDAHIYKNHINKLEKQVERKPYEKPIVRIKKRDDIDNFVYDDISLLEYNHHPSIELDVAV
jgi:thymidylate synthase